MTTLTRRTCLFALSLLATIGCNPTTKKADPVDAKAKTAAKDDADVPLAPDADAADLILLGGKVVTVDKAKPKAEAVAMKDGKILAVGTDAEIEKMRGKATKVVELGGKLAIPGLIEGHGHYMSMGNALMVLDLNHVKNWDEVVKMVGEAAKKAKPGEWILGRGWHQEKWDKVPEPNVDGVPVHTSLSAVSPDNPVLLGHASGHAAFANAKAMELAGIGKDTKDPPGGTIIRDDKGNATGGLREKAQILVSTALSKYEEGLPSAEREAKRIKQHQLAAQECLENGITSFHDAGSSFATIDFFKNLGEHGNLPVRLYVMVRRESNEVMDEKLPAYKMQNAAGGFLTVRSIKRQIDGALGPHGAWLLQPYTDLPTSTGLVLEKPEDIAQTAAIAIKHGFQVNTHAIGDRANRETMDIYAKAFSDANVDSKDLRWRIEHAQHLHPEDVPRMKELGLIASMQGVHCTSDAPYVLKRLGEERAESGAYLWRTFLDQGTVVNNGTDVPVEDINPIASYYASVTRQLKDGSRFYEKQKMTREEALYSYTMANAYAAFEEDVKGSITVGKFADVVVLSQDLLTVPDDKIMDTKVDMTIVGGKVAYERK